MGGRAARGTWRAPQGLARVELIGAGCWWLADADGSWLLVAILNDCLLVGCLVVCLAVAWLLGRLVGLCRLVGLFVGWSLVGCWLDSVAPPAGHTALDFLAGSPLDSPTAASPGGHHRRGRPGRLEASFRTFSIVRYCGGHDHRLSWPFHDSWLLVLPQVVARDRAHATQRHVIGDHTSIDFGASW